MKGLVSVIIPVYKVEKYLDECVNSVVNQTYKNLEIILVDDGSPDNCPAICDAWAEKDSRIKVIHKENGGLSDARNTGMDHSSGEYILFVDSDDYYENNNSIELLVDTACSKESDVVCFNYKRFYENKNSFSPKLCTVPKYNTIDDMVKNNVYTSSAGLKLISRSLVADSGLLFEKGIYSEDIEFSAKLMLLAQNITFCDDAVYVYRSRSGSITTSIKEKNITDIFNVIEKLTKAVTDNRCYWCYTAFQYCTLLINMNFAEIDSGLKQKIYDMKWLLKYNDTSKVKLIYIVSRLLGIKLTSKLLFIYFKAVN